MLDELKARAAVVLGAGMLATIGRNRFYRLAQDRRGIAGRIAAAFCHGHAGRLGRNYGIFLEERDKERITSIAARHYSDDDLWGAATENYRWADGKEILDQQRGLIIPLVEKAIGSDFPKTVCEIGCGSGELPALLAAKHPNIEFVGVDLSVTHAKRLHQAPNLRFEAGYALDMLQDGRLKADIYFGTSTFCIFAPKEMRAYIEAMAGPCRVIISDPVTFGNVHTRDPEPKSRHMDYFMWWHNYFGYLTAAGWTVDHHETVNFAYSYNPNAKVVLVSAYRR
jgi:SAM-dependent methyltransferase